MLKERKIKNRIQHKAHRNRPLTHWQKAFNKLVSKTRYVAKRTFGGMKRWFGAGVARHRGIEKMHTQHILEAICYNLKRVPGFGVSISDKMRAMSEKVPFRGSNQQKKRNCQEKMIQFGK